MKRSHEEIVEAIRKYNKKPFIRKCANPKCPHHNEYLVFDENDTKEFLNKLRSYKESGKVFCSQSCANSYNNKVHNDKGSLRYKHRQETMDAKEPISKLSNQEIRKIYKESDNAKDFMRRAGYPVTDTSYKQLTKAVLRKFEDLGLDPEKLKLQPQDFSGVTKGDLKKKYKGEHKKVRSDITMNATSVYNKSGRQKTCICCGWGEHVDMAHVKAVSQFNDNALITEINDINNIVALCPNCHWCYDKGNEEQSGKVKKAIDKYIAKMKGK